MKDSYRNITILFIIVLMISYVIACGGGGGDSGGVDNVNLYPRTADLAGDWQVRQVQIINAAEGSTWWIVNTTIGSNGVLGDPVGVTNSGYAINSFYETIRLKVKSDGTVHTFADGVRNQYAAGFMNSGSNLLISVEGEGSTEVDGETAITVGQRVVNGTTYADADLTGAWKVFSYIVPSDGAAKWYNSFASIYECGFVTSGECKYDLRYVQMNGESLSDVLGETITIDSDGRISTPTDVTYDGFMSADKNLIAAVASSNGGSEAVISFMVRSDENQTYDATDLAGQYGYVSSKVMTASSFTSSWEMGHINIALDGNVSGTLVSNEDLSAHDMLSSSGLPLGYGMEMLAGVLAPKYGGYALVDGYMINTTTGERVMYIKGPDDTDSYVMGLGSNMDFGIMASNSVADDGITKTTVLGIFHREKNCLDAGYCTSDIGARTADLAASANGWRIGGLLIGNSLMSSSFMIFNATMGTDGTMNVGFSNMLNPGDGSIVEISDMMPVGEGPEYGVFRLDADSTFWESDRYYDTFRGYLDSTGELLIGVDTDYEFGKGYTGARLFTMQNTSAAGSYDATAIMSATDQWKVVNFSATYSSAYWSVLNTTVASVTDPALGCVEIGVGIDNSLGIAASPPAGAKFDVTLADNGGFAVVNSVGTGCSDGTADAFISAYMSADGMSAFGLSNSSGAGAKPELHHFIRVLNAPSSYAQSDLTGTWRESYISADGNGGLFGAYGTINIGSAVDINGTEYSDISGSEYMYHTGRFCDVGDDDCDGTVDAMMLASIDTTNGMISVYVNMPPIPMLMPDTYMFMSADKKLMYMLMNEGNDNLAIHVFQKQ